MTASSRRMTGTYSFTNIKYLFCCGYLLSRHMNFVFVTIPCVQYLFLSGPVYLPALAPSPVNWYIWKSNLHQSALVGVVDYLVYGYQTASHHTHIVLFSGIGGVNVERRLPFLYLVRGDLAFRIDCCLHDPMCLGVSAYASQVGLVVDAYLSLVCIV